MSPSGDAIFRLWQSDMLAVQARYVLARREREERVSVLREAKRDMSPSGDAIFRLRQSDMLAVQA